MGRPHFLDFEAAHTLGDLPALNVRDFASLAKAALPFADFGGSSRPQTTTTVQNNTPPDYARPALTAAAGDALQLYQQNAGFKPYTGPVNANLSGETTAGLSHLMYQANQRQALADQSYGKAQGLLGSNGLTDQNQFAWNQFADASIRSRDMPSASQLNLSGIASGAQGIGTGAAYNDVMQRASGMTDAQANLSGIANTGGPSTAGDYRSLLSGLGAPTAAQGYADPIASGAQGITTGSGYNAFTANAGFPSAAERNLSGIGAGSEGLTTGSSYQDFMLGTGNPTAAQTNLAGMAGDGAAENPWLQQQAKAAEDRAANRALSLTSASGRLGANNATLGLLGKAVTEASLPIFAQDYENRQNRRLAATGQMDAARQGQQSMQLAGMQGLTGVQQQNLQNRIGASAQMDAGRTQRDQSLLAGLAGQTGVQSQNLSNQLQGSSLLGSLGQAQTQAQLSGLAGLTSAQNQGVANKIGASNAIDAAARARDSQYLAGAQGLTGQRAQDIANQLASSSAIDASNQARIQSQLAGAAGAENVATAGLNRAGNIMGMAPQMEAQRYDPAMRMLGVGSLFDQRAQNDTNQQKAIWEAEQARQWDMLARMNAIASGAGQLGQSRSTTAPVQQPSLLQSILGGAGVGGSLLGPYGAIGGGLLGALTGGR